MSFWEEIRDLSIGAVGLVTAVVGGLLAFAIACAIPVLAILGLLYGIHWIFWGQ